MLEHLQDCHQINVLNPEKGTYALLLYSDLVIRVQVGRWSQIDIQHGYYIYIGSAFGPGGVRARVSRHLRVDKPKRWHIDYLREFATPFGLWTSYEPEPLEHQWAQVLHNMEEVTSVKGFGCSDCKCYSHLFHTTTPPDFTTLFSHFGNISKAGITQYAKRNRK